MLSVAVHMATDFLKEVASQHKVVRATWTIIVRDVVNSIRSDDGCGRSSAHPALNKRGSSRCHLTSDCRPPKPPCVHYDSTCIFAFTGDNGVHACRESGSG